MKIPWFTTEMPWANACSDIAEPHVNRLCVEAKELMIEGRLLDLKWITSSRNGILESRIKDHLETFLDEDSYTINEAKEDVACTSIYFVTPGVFQCNLDMPATAQLEKDAKYALVYQLLKIFLTQKLEAYLDFQAANSALLESYMNIV
ncbi:hypothetical protein RND71_020933 [Anisodus tanguticus]|uniref:Uncharacterized protein n=1 Tax=Anisodus tanguticus TaxID=243964 RepID=A0AAE1VEQ9_9SOLA|nr:hypothetical protein RND71_020933 [Anisodus tanguticus]